MELEIPLAALGIDSLVSIELRNWFRQLDFSVLEITGASSIRHLGGIAAAKLGEKYKGLNHRSAYREMPQQYVSLTENSASLRILPSLLHCGFSPPDVGPHDSQVAIAPMQRFEVLREWLLHYYCMSIMWYMPEVWESKAAEIC